MNSSKIFSRYAIPSLVLLLSAAVVGCSDRDPILGIGAGVVTTQVSVLSSNPTAAATLVCPDATIEVTFTVPSGLGMDPLTVNNTTFTVVGPGPLFTPVTATSITMDVPTSTIATFTPNAPLVDGDVYTITIVSGAGGVKDMAPTANEMAVDFTSTFTAGPGSGACAGPSTIAMGLAEPFGIAATAGVTNAPTAPLTHINGNVVLDPDFSCNAVAVDNAGGFGLCGGSPPTINGQVITNTFPNTTDSAAIKADLNAAFLSITPPAGPPAVGSLAGGTPIAAPTTMGAPGVVMVLGDNYFTPGVWISGTSILISDDVTLDGQGDPNAEFFFQSASTLTTADGAASPGVHTRILLINGAKASNVWWQVASSATLGDFTEFNGNVLAAIDITMKVGATSCGRLMAGAWVGVPGGMGAFVFESNTVSIPGNGCPQ